MPASRGGCGDVEDDIDVDRVMSFDLVVLVMNPDATGPAQRAALRLGRHLAGTLGPILRCLFELAAECVADERGVLAERAAEIPILVAERVIRFEAAKDTAACTAGDAAQLWFGRWHASVVLASPPTKMPSYLGFRSHPIVDATRFIGTPRTSNSSTTGRIRPRVRVTNRHPGCVLACRTILRFPKSTDTRFDHSTVHHTEESSRLPNWPSLIPTQPNRG